MQINQFTKWKLIYEDETQCFSKAVDRETDNDVIVITYFNVNDLSKTVRLLLNEALHNVMDIIEDSNGLHIVINAIKGNTLEKYVSFTNADYTERVQITYEWLKRIQLYEQFPDSVKVQLVDLDQVVVSNHQMLSRELIDYTNHDDIDLIDVFKQVGLTLDTILQDAKGPQREFIDNLCVGTHNIFSFSLLRKQFKDVFIYEKDEALKNINYEYHIILNDRESDQPPIKPIKVEMPEPSLPLEESEMDDALVDIETNKSEDEVVNRDEDEENTEILESSPADEKIDEVKLDEMLDDMPDVMPKISRSSKEMVHDDILDHEVDDMFDDFADDEIESNKISIPKLAIIVTSISLVLVIIAIILFKPDPVEAKFKMDELPHGRVAFINQSSGKADTETYLWEIYYDDAFVSSFTDNDFYPVFETEGRYTISLKIKDKEGNWSDPYVIDYTFKKE